MKYGLETNQPDFPAAVAERGNAHFDGTGVKVIDISPRSIDSLSNTFDTIVGNDVWDYKKSPNHVHVLPDGLNNDQMAILVNTLNILVPICAPFFCFGTQFRDGWQRWSSPVLDRFTGSQIGEALCSGQTVGVFTNTVYGIRSYRSTALTALGGVEIRICEQHPRWILPPLKTIDAILEACLRRGKSVKLVDHPNTIATLWGNIRDHGVYDGLKRTEVTFFANRNIPYIVSQSREGENFTVNAFELYKMICRRFKNAGHHLRGFEKVLTAFENEVDVSALPRNEMWLL